MIKKFVKLQIETLNNKIISFNKNLFCSSTHLHTERTNLRIITKSEAKLPTDSIIPLCVFTETSLRFNRPKDFINIFKKDIPYSRYKLNTVLQLIRKKNVNDAILLLQQVNKKGAALVLYELEKIVKKFHEKEDNYFNEQFVIAEAFVGGRLGPPKIDMKGRMKHGIRNKPYSRFTIRLKKITPNKFMTDVIMGKSNFYHSNLMKALIFKNKFSFLTMKSWSFMTASKSKYYRRTQIKRLICLIKSYLKQKGIVVSHEYVNLRVTHYLLNYKFFDYENFAKKQKYKDLMMRMETFSQKYQKI